MGRAFPLLLSRAVLRFANASLTQMTNHALEDEWAGGLTEDYVDRVRDHLLSNFAERWMENKGIRADAVADFLSETMNDHFEVEVPHGISYALAKVLCKLYDELRDGDVRGAVHVLGEEEVKNVLNYVEVVQGRVEKDKPMVVVEQEDDVVMSTAATSTEAAVLGEAQEEDDGWTTVKKKKKR